MRHRYQRKKREHGEVELNMAAMLDMAFQLLAFFILTFRPSAVESQISLRMPQAIIDGRPGDVVVIEPPKQPPEDFGESLEMRLYATPAGEIARIQVEGRQIPGDQPLDQVLAQLNGLLPQMLVGSKEGVSLLASNDLLYERLMQVVDVCTRQRMPQTGELLNRISIGHLPGG
jgi:biopolymer transport protein ExbD